MSLWKYCNSEQCLEMLLSFQLFTKPGWSDRQIISCLYAVSNHAERHYHEVKIKKKAGGIRTLLVPDNLLKKIQKNILHHILDGFSVSACATAYHKGAGVVENAGPHRGKKIVLKLDIEDFFGSITFPMVKKSAFPDIYFPPSVGTLLTTLCCFRGCLPQGAPTSPAVSNLVMRPFDLYMKSWCDKRGITYTRYCDDMTFSGDFPPGIVIKKVSGFLDSMGFSLKQEKTRILYGNGRQAVTGIVVNEKLQVPKEYRKKVRQEVYYCLKYGIKSHMERSGVPLCQEDLELSYIRSLFGKIHFILMVNPDDKYFLEAEVKVKQCLEAQTETNCLRQES